MPARKKQTPETHDCDCTRTASDAEAEFGRRWSALTDDEKLRIAMRRVEADPFMGALLAAVREIDAKESGAKEMDAKEAAPAERDAPPSKKKIRTSNTSTTQRKPAR
jgi:hypothetical protein